MKHIYLWFLSEEDSETGTQLKIVYLGSDFGTHRPGKGQMKQEERWPMTADSSGESL